jgi:hypothetical protein
MVQATAGLIERFSEARGGTTVTLSPPPPQPASTAAPKALEVKARKPRRVNVFCKIVSSFFGN